MPAKPLAVFLDFETLGPSLDTSELEALVDVRYHDRSEPTEVARRLAECEIAIVNKCDVDGDAIRASKRLELIALTGTGSDNVDVAAAKQRGIAVANSRGYCTTSLAQHVFALILTLTRQIEGFTALVRRGAWAQSRMFAMFDYPVRDLSGRTLGVVGSGTLGQEVARLAECFGMRVSVAARLGTPCDQVPAGRTHFDRLLEQADVLSLHCPLNATTKHMIGASQLKRMKRDALLINTARGGLIDSVALAAALRAGEIGGAGIDVLATEPPPADHPLLAPDIPNLIVTPHVAWTAQEARQRALDQVTENIADFLRGGTLRRLV
ncbi:MAG TPA: D-2-hydroxyacid dehydrogenase [Gammaproteobacteria bacterium]|nr:D-2-hydroxyacid dehydrogenase [Gammaproteobacteria bacterium]